MIQDPQSKKFVNMLTVQNQEFIIVGLTGKVRSGTSDVARLLTNHNFRDTATQPANTQGFDMGNIREFKVIYRYLHTYWKPFVELSVTSVIVSFLLDPEIKIDDLCNHKLNYADDNGCNVKGLLDKCLKNTNFGERVKSFYFKMLDTIKLYFNDDENRINRDITNDLLKFNNLEELRSKWEDTRNRIMNKAYVIDDAVFCYGILPALAELMEAELGKDKAFTTTFQDFGNNIRAFGQAVHSNNSTDHLEAKNLFILPERINHFIKVLRHYISLKEDKQDQKEKKSYPESNPVFIVINNFKNIFETFYFRRRYSAFFLMAVSCDEKNRQARFDDIRTYRLADLRENLASAKKVYKSINEALKKDKDRQGKETKNDSVEIKKVCSDLGLSDFDSEFYLNSIYGNKLREECYGNNLAPFILQDIMTCIENADVFVTRDYNESEYKYDYPLIRSLARFATLVLHPGLLTPTKIERCMQIAITAKLNSGCLSRQVGAVVTDNEYNIISLGWNDAPCGVESCIRRNLFDLLRKHDPEAYSDYELYDTAFRSYVDIINAEVKDNYKDSFEGLPAAFCFKDIYQDIINQRDQIYTRALHGEERALAACGNERAKGGYLFTTSSPCELCAKKAKEANISKIYFIEQYPGISHTHVIDAGPREKRAEYEYFVGAVGLAYVKLYTPLIPYKDELAAFGFSPSHIYKNSIESKKKEQSGSSEDIKKLKKSDGAEGQVQQLSQQ